MKLASPITVQPPSYTRKTGEVRSFSPIVFKELTFSFIDSPHRKMCMARIAHIPRPIVLWSGDEYTAAGDYTQAQVEARILELLGDNPKSVLESLFVPPPNRVVQA